MACEQLGPAYRLHNSGSPVAGERCFCILRESHKKRISYVYIYHIIPFNVEKNNTEEVHQLPEGLQHPVQEWGVR